MQILTLKQLFFELKYFLPKLKDFCPKRKVSEIRLCLKSVKKSLFLKTIQIDSVLRDPSSSPPAEDVVRSCIKEHFHKALPNSLAFIRDMGVRIYCFF